VRERGALVGCDTATALIHFSALGPDVLSVPEPVTALAGGKRAAAGVVRVLAGIAAASGAKALAHGVNSATGAAKIAALGVSLAQGDAVGPPEAYVPRPAGNVSSALFGLPRPRGPVARDRPGVRAGEPMSAIVDACLGAEDHDWVVLVDERAHPVRLVERAALLRGEPFEHRAVAIHPAMSLEDVATVALERPVADRSRPLAVCDGAGRYRGLLMIDPTPSPVGA
jgi:hypothetical protein